jgi:hypothetical protein
VVAEHIDTLNQARESFVRKRRAMAEQMIPAGAAAQHFAPVFTDLQNAIEAIDRAIADEQNLPEGYAAKEPEAVQPAARDGSDAMPSNVVDVDFDPS